MSHFEKAIISVLQHEGGKCNVSGDRGGLTAYGISQTAYPALDIANLTREQAIEIYRRDYWRPYYDQMPYQVAAKTFDLAVNAGHHRAHVVLQRALSVVDDGIIGPATIEAANSQPVADTLAAMVAEQIRFYDSLVAKTPADRIFYVGWTYRAEWIPDAVA